MKIEWEDIYTKEVSIGLEVGTWRAEVIGGWLISHTLNTNGKLTNSLIFIPDENHCWGKNIMDDVGKEL